MNDDEGFPIALADSGPICICRFARSAHRTERGRHRNPSPIYPEHDFKRSYFQGHTSLFVFAECECGKEALRHKFAGHLSSFELGNELKAKGWTLNGVWRCQDCSESFAARQLRKERKIYAHGAAFLPLAL